MGLDFTKILRAEFLCESVRLSLSVLTVCVCILSENSNFELAVLKKIRKTD